MVIVPCSMSTLGRLATGSGDNALLRTGDVFLKERRKLIVVPRETPWSLIHARNVVTLLEAGAIVLPAIPSFYNRPASVTEVVDTVVWRILDQLGLPNPRAFRWKDGTRQPPRRKLKLRGRPARWLTRVRLSFAADSGRARCALKWRIARASSTNRPARRSSPPSGTIVCSSGPTSIRRYLPNYAGTALDQRERRWRNYWPTSSARYGFDIVRGSSSRKGAARSAAIGRVAGAGHVVGIIPDGPRGPAYRLAGGIVYLAQKSGAPVVPMNMEFSQLLAVEKLGSLHFPASVFDCACNIRRRCITSPRPRAKRNLNPSGCVWRMR